MPAKSLKLLEQKALRTAVRLTTGASWHMCKIQDKESTIVELLTLKTYAWSAIWCLAFSIDANIHAGAGHRDQSLSPGFVFV
jgi:hypothetical protein